MAKRANGEGSMRRRADGKHEVRISYYDDAGRRVRRSFYGDTQKEAREKAKTAQKRLDRALPVIDARTPLVDWVEQWQRSTLEASDRKAATKALYRSLARTHVAPALGAQPLGNLRPHHVDGLTLSMRARGLSDSTVRTTYTVLRAILDAAVTAKLIADNPAAVVGRPKVTRVEARHLSALEVRAILDAAKSSRHGDVLALIAGTGLRRGEALATRWTDLDLDKSVLRVRGTLGRVSGDLVVTTPKTVNSRRDIVLTPGMVALLRRHRIAQVAERLASGSQWVESGLVFTTELGAPVDPRNLFRAFVSAVKRSGVEGDGIGLHTLRHSAATSMLEAGVPLHVVSRILGHSSVAITGDIYGHVSDSRQREAMDTLSAALGL